MRTIPTCVVFLLALICLLSSAPRAENAGSDQVVRVTATSLNMRSGPSTEAAVVGKAARGQNLVVIEREGDWIQVKTEDGKTGWVSSKYVEEVSAAPEDQIESKEKPAEKSEKAPSPAHHQARGESKGGSALGTILKWGCLAGAAATGYLAYNEHSKGNDAYDHYKSMVLTQHVHPDVAEPERVKATDHDSSSLTYTIVAGSLFTAFVIQAFLLGGGSDHADGASGAPAEAPAG